MIFCSINGKEISDLAVNDRGLAYGDGLFTTAKVKDGQVDMLEQHVNRLIKGCLFLGIDIEHLGDIKKQIISSALTYDLAVLKVIITAGSGGRGYSRVGLSKQSSNLIIIISDFPTHYFALAETGITLAVSKQAISISPMLSGLKHLNRLEQVLLRQELDSQPVDDLVVSNANNEVIETTCANIFYLRDNRWHTPDVSLSGVNGLMRQKIINLLGNIKVSSTSIEELMSAKEIFICNSIMGILPVKRLAQNELLMSQSKRIRDQLID